MSAMIRVFKVKSTLSLSLLRKCVLSVVGVPGIAAFLKISIRDGHGNYYTLGSYFYNSSNGGENKIVESVLLLYNSFLSYYSFNPVLSQIIIYYETTKKPKKRKL
uniref:Open reading frame 314 n=2 Tax=Carybdea alata TaxID=1193083 RepID=G9IC01_CARAL|nr:open reading frame 314 [Alatina alata]